MVSRQRSPNYPGVNLGEAIEFARELYAKVGRGQFHADDAASTWGYRGPSGPVRVRLAAFRQYGMLDGSRGENPKLSRRALTFVLRNQASREYKSALQEAALAPALFRELRDTRPDASDGVLREYLIIDKNFTDDGAERAISVYRATMLLADLDRGDIMSGLNGDDSLEEIEEDIMATEAPPERSVEPVRANVPRGSFSIPVPLDAERMATITLPINMQDADWARLDRILQAYKPPRSEEGGSTTGESPPDSNP